MRGRKKKQNSSFFGQYVREWKREERGREEIEAPTSLYDLWRSGGRNSSG